MKHKIIPTALLLLSASFTIKAQDTSCTYTSSTTPEFFVQSVELGKLVGEKLCQKYNPATNAIPDITIEEQEISALANLWKSTLLTEANDLRKVNANLDLQVNSLYQGYFAEGALTSFQVNKKGRGLLIKVTDEDIVNVKNRSACKTLSYEADCQKVFEEFASAANYPYFAIDAINLDKVYDSAKQHAIGWNNYFEHGRSQTFTDLLLNTWLYKDELQSGEPVAPPDKQWFLLHPSLVMQYIDDATDGEQMKEALAVEWLGVNYWNAKVPWGVSLVSTYADRASTKDVGHGLMVHIKNDYSIGFTRNGDENSIFVTFDLLKLFEDKHSNYKKYISYIK